MTHSELLLAVNAIVRARTDLDKHRTRYGSTKQLKREIDGLRTAQLVCEHALNQLTERQPA